MVAILGLWLGCGLPAWGAEAPALTLEELQQRLEHPIQRDGRPVIDLRRVTLDLRPERGEWGDRFYRLVQQRLQSGTVPVGLDLSNAHVLGDLDLQRLSLREPLYGEALFPLLTPEEQAQLRRDRRRLSQLSQLSRSLLLQPQGSSQSIFLFRSGLNLTQAHLEGRLQGTDTFFLGPIQAAGARFDQGVNFAEARFSREVVFTGSQFQGVARFRNSLFFRKARFGQSRFAAVASFEGTQFQETAVFAQANFEGEARFTRCQFQGNGDFARTQWLREGSFVKARFGGELFLTETRIETVLTLRQARFGQRVNLRGATVLGRLDLGDGIFLPGVRVNVAAMDLSAEGAELLGSPGQVGRVLSVPSLEGNETLLRNLVRNFRRLEQVADANQVEYTTERLRWASWGRQLTGVNLNTAPSARLEGVGFSPTQVAAILAYRQAHWFLSREDMLTVAGIDLADFVKVRDRVVARPPGAIFDTLILGLRWVFLGILLTTSHYGTHVSLTLGVGLGAITLSSLLFWGVDRYRRWRPTPILPSPWEVGAMGLSGASLGGVALAIILSQSPTPGLTLLTLAGVVLPVPLGLILWLYRQGRYHDLMESSYLLEDGSARQLRLLIARLPILPSFPFFRDRYTPIPWDRRRNWLNYFDFSLNNWFKFGFNDLRLRDTQVPGPVTALVWYQWGAGLLYVTLLLWTLSRTIPGLNLLLYF